MKNRYFNFMTMDDTSPMIDRHFKDFLYFAFDYSLLNFKNSSGCLFDRNSIFHISKLNLTTYCFLI